MTNFIDKNGSPDEVSSDPLKTLIKLFFKSDIGQMGLGPKWC